MKYVSPCVMMAALCLTYATYSYGMDLNEKLSEEAMHAWIIRYSPKPIIPLWLYNKESSGQANKKKTVVKKIRQSNGIIKKIYSDGTSKLIMPVSTLKKFVKSQAGTVPSNQK